jgi:hypothetical protein
MAKKSGQKKAKSPADTRKGKHSLDANRASKSKSGSGMRDASTVKRLKMYNSGKAVRDKKGKFLRQASGAGGPACNSTCRQLAGLCSQCLQ